MKKQAVARWIWDIIVILFGTGIFALGFYVFTVPNHIAPGGVSGLGTAVNYLLPAIPIGTFTLVINIPLLLVGYRFLGKKFTIRTLIATLAFTVWLDVAYPLFMPTYQGDPILASLFGGVLIGSGLAFVFMREGSTGGMDIINKLIQRKFPHMQIGRLIFASDLVVIAIAALIFRNIESALYAVIAMFVSARVMDAILYGLNTGKLVLIVTGQPEPIAEAVIERLERTTTILSGKGGYSGAERPVVMCAVRNSEFYKLKRIVQGIDETAFLIVTEAGQVIGEGFKPIHKDD